MSHRVFSQQTFRFLSGLALNNSRDWFEAHRDDYEQFVREPALALIRDFAPRLEKLSKHLVASDKKLGGSLMRVHRDVRFSSDKSPYKTNIGIQFRHRAAKDVHAPGFYLHLSPGDCFVGAGTWHPDPNALWAIRERIAERPRDWQRVTGSRDFTGPFRLAGDSLARPPKGFSPEHPHIEDLKRKDFIATCPLTHKDAASPRLLALLEARFAATRPLMRFLCRALGIPF